MKKKQTDIILDKNILKNMKDDAERFRFISAHYVETSFVTSQRKLPGFSNAEISKMDKKRSFTDDKVLFLTFNDWGTEQSVNELLYVLEKNDVKATFFITTQYADSNPNMLRAIAEQGYQIASHTDEHLPLSNSVNGSNRAVSKIGTSQIFDVGYTYSVSGDMSTDDYKAKSYYDMVRQLKNGITDGGYQMYIIKTKKDKIKILRAVLEGIVLLLLLFAIFRALSTHHVYQPYDASDKSIVSGEDEGFLVVSDVDRQGTDTLISTKQLDEHLKALHDLGVLLLTGGASKKPQEEPMDTEYLTEDFSAEEISALSEVTNQLSVWSFYWDCAEDAGLGVRIVLETSTPVSKLTFPTRRNTA